MEIELNIYLEVLKKDEKEAMRVLQDFKETFLNDWPFIEDEKSFIDEHGLIASYRTSGSGENTKKYVRIRQMLITSISLYDVVQKTLETSWQSKFLPVVKEKFEDYDSTCVAVIVTYDSFTNHSEHPDSVRKSNIKLSYS